MKMRQLERIDQLETGMIIRHKSGGNPHVVQANYGNHAVAVHVQDITNPDEWVFGSPHTINTGMLIENPDRSITLCGKGKCCPTVKQVDENTYEVTDDDGNTVRVTRAQLALIPDAVKVIDDQQLICG